MKEEHRSTQIKTCGSKFRLETKWTCRAGTGNQTRGQWSTARGKYCYATCFLRLNPGARNDWFSSHKDPRLFCYHCSLSKRAFIVCCNTAALPRYRLLIYHSSTQRTASQVHFLAVLQCSS